MKAFEKLQEFKANTIDLREREESMKFGLEIFDIEPIHYPELQIVEREISLLSSIWEVKEEWDKKWEEWKEIRFCDADIEELGNDGEDFKARIEKMDKELKEWGVYNYQKQQIVQFTDTLTLLEQLKTEAMRERHWKDIRFEVKADFDENSEDFTLDKLFSLGLLAHQGFIYELVDNAKKQLRIETDLAKIE